MLEIQREALAKTLEGKKREGYSYLKKITAVDYGDSLEVLYIIYSPAKRASEIVKVKIGSAKPSIPTIMKTYSGADWHERELSEMFGIEIKGRKAPRLLLEKWNGIDAPLRKSFVWGDPKYRKV